MRFVLGPGAFGSAVSMRPFVTGLERRGFQAEAIQLPRGRADRAAQEFTARSGPGVIAGGHSFGGRAASLAAAESEFAGLVCFSYPLRDSPDQRTLHWPRIACPVLVINGSADPLCDALQLRQRMGLLRDGRLKLIEGVGHDLSQELELVLDFAAGFAATLGVR